MASPKLWDENLMWTNYGEIIKFYHGHISTPSAGQELYNYDQRAETNSLRVVFQDNGQLFILKWAIPFYKHIPPIEE